MMCNTAQETFKQAQTMLKAATAILEITQTQLSQFQLQHSAPPHHRIPPVNNPQPTSTEDQTEAISIETSDSSNESSNSTLNTTNTPVVQVQHDPTKDVVQSKTSTPEECIMELLSNRTYKTESDGMEGANLFNQVRNHGYCIGRTNFHNLLSHLEDTREIMRGKVEGVEGLSGKLLIYPVKKYILLKKDE